MSIDLFKPIARASRKQFVVEQGKIHPTPIKEMKDQMDGSFSFDFDDGCLTGLAAAHQILKNFSIEQAVQMIAIAISVKAEQVESKNP